MTLGERLTQLRNQKGLSQDALAEIIGVSRQSVSKWETDASIPDLDKLVRLSDFFEVTLDELVKGSVPAAAAPEQPVRQPWLQRLAALYRKKAHWLGWLVVAWGIYSFMNAAQGLAYYCRNTDAESALRWMKAMSWLYALHGFKLLLGLFIVLWGRRFSGRFRWYHLGWALIIWSLFRMGSPMESLLAGLLLYLPYYGADQMLEYLALWPEDLGELSSAFWAFCSCILESISLLFNEKFTLSSSSP